MRIVVCAKEVLDPDAVNNYALSGGLAIGDDGRTITSSAIPRLMNAYDEQAIEAALRIKEAGADHTVTVVSAGPDPAAILKHAVALGADEIVSIPIEDAGIDYHVVANLLAAYVRSSEGAGLILCGRQASDDDQGVVPALIAESLDMPLISIARAVALSAGGTVRVTRVTPDGNEIVEADCPAVVTISNEFGEPRYPTASMTIRARRTPATVVTMSDLGDVDLAARVTLVEQSVPIVQGNCEVIDGESPSVIARDLVRRLHEDGILS
ncbi:MAG: electron transfer flavoprotein subunit beta/FixA family protein [Chloroflexi bacterium]|nr:electron transfer flavoprotein subunit beta/FixA family protein [Chloroflexota bacterium]